MDPKLWGTDMLSDGRLTHGSVAHTCLYTTPMRMSRQMSKLMPAQQVYATRKVSRSLERILTVVVDFASGLRYPVRQRGGGLKQGTVLP